MDPIWKSPLTATGNVRRQSQALLGQWIKTAVNRICCQCFKLLEMKALTVTVNTVTCLECCTSVMHILNLIII